MLLAIPPTPSGEAARARAATLARALRGRGVDVDIEVSASYAALGDHVLVGRTALAWAPPIVCSRVEMGGGRVALRAVRGGVTAYRAGLVCRADATIDLADTERLVAAWVDEDSAGGYLLARSWLKARKVDAVRGFKRALFLGSYVAALQAVADARADVASVYMSTEGAPPHSTLDEVENALAAKLRVFATTGETQTDGIVVAPAVTDEDSAPVVDAMLALGADAAGAQLLRQVLGCESLKRAPATPTSKALRELVSLIEREPVLR